MPTILSVSLPRKIRSLVEREAKRGRRSRSAIVRDALQVYFKLRRIGVDQPTKDERYAIAEGRRAYNSGAFDRYDKWRHAVGLGDH
jgi:metal-responsive CopG/Arc/MetJ family transcriptional regulator